MKLLVTAAAAVLIATQSFAGTYQVRCQTESVPYQEAVKGGTPEEVLGGAIIGGLLGKAATDDNGAAAIGAIIGGALANESSTTTVTRYRDVETCTNVFVPDRITDEAELESILIDLKNGRSVSREVIMDVQYTIGVAYDGSWGPKSRRAADEYLAHLEADAAAEVEVEVEATETTPLFTLVVNDVVIVSSPDVAAIDEIKTALGQAGVASQIIVDLQ
jgi:uncharacterized protein YcfJ